jgi:hypothetical protein
MTLQIFKEQVLYYNKARLLCQYMVLFLRHTKQKTQTFEGLGLVFEVSFTTLVLYSYTGPIEP